MEIFLNCTNGAYFEVMSLTLRMRTIHYNPLSRIGDDKLKFNVYALEHSLQEHAWNISQTSSGSMYDKVNGCLYGKPIEFIDNSGWTLAEEANQSRIPDNYKLNNNVNSKLIEF